MSPSRQSLMTAMSAANARWRGTIARSSGTFQ
jgi:hypothetical protein